MKLPLPFCLVLCLTGTSCDRHAELQRELTTLESAVKQDQAATQQYEKDLVALGGTDAVSRISQQITERQEKIRQLEFDNAARDRKWSAIETTFAKLKPAAEAYKAAQPK